MARPLLLDRVDVLVDRVGRPRVPLLLAAVVRRAHADELLQAARQEVPAEADVLVQRARLVLGQDEDPPEPRVDAVREREVDDPVGPPEGHRGLRATRRERLEPLALAAGQDQGERLVQLVGQGHEGIVRRRAERRRRAEGGKAARRPNSRMPSAAPSGYPAGTRDEGPPRCELNSRAASLTWVPHFSGNDDQFPPTMSTVASPTEPLLTLSRTALDERALDFEWLETDGRSGYATSTVAAVPTRRYHGLLVAPTESSRARHVFLSRFEETLAGAETAASFSAARYGDHLAPRGFEALERFELAPWPRSTYSLDGARVTREVLMVRGASVTLVRYTAEPSPAGRMLELRPLFACRQADALTVENDVLRPELARDRRRVLLPALRRAAQCGCDLERRRGRRRGRPGLVPRHHLRGGRGARVRRQRGSVQPRRAPRAGRPRGARPGARDLDRRRRRGPRRPVGHGERGPAGRARAPGRRRDAALATRGRRRGLPLSRGRRRARAARHPGRLPLVRRVGVATRSSRCPA